eukprot:TRINITY_DN32492_c0_g1_i1.p1 TRINITY_DN32492_c0_g1~~TRINITY_DN32492_c0_g1_i1.p1  ORF type:complete len:261 (+),score=81.04 TRINITY_DN32492_c0_g1_i1:41-823(+)
MSEDMMRTFCGNLGLDASVIKDGLNLYREMKASHSQQDLSSSMEYVICLHLAAQKNGHNLDLTKAMKVSGSKSKPKYQNAYRNAQKLLKIKSTLNLKEICLKVGMNDPGIIEETRQAFNLYKNSISKKFGQEKIKELDFTKPVYLCAAVHAIGKFRKLKIDADILSSLAMEAKKDIFKYRDEMFALLTEASKAKKNGGREALKSLQEEDVPSMENEDDNRKRKCEEENDLDEAESYKIWKNGILNRAVAAGFSQYKKFIV